MHLRSILCPEIYVHITKRFKSKWDTLFIEINEITHIILNMFD